MKVRMQKIKLQDLHFMKTKRVSFRSIDSLVSNTQVQDKKSDLEPKFTYHVAGKIISKIT